MSTVVCRLHGHGARALATYMHLLEAHDLAFVRGNRSLKVLFVKKHVGTGRWAADKAKAARYIPARNRSLLSHVLPG